MEVKEKPPTLTIVSLNNDSIEEIDIGRLDQFSERCGAIARDESRPDLPLELSEHTFSPNDFTMVIAMSGKPVLFVDGCWVQEVSAEIWDRAEQRYRDAVKTGLAANHRSHEPTGPPTVPWAAVTVLCNFNQVPPSIEAMIGALVPGMIFESMNQVMRRYRRGKDDKQNENENV